MIRQRLLLAVCQIKHDPPFTSYILPDNKLNARFFHDNLY